MFAIAASAQVYVKPHTNKDGTYTEGHYRSSPNNTDRDNYGTKGNTNPYTGQDGTVTPQRRQTKLFSAAIHVRAAMRLQFIRTQRL